MSNSFKVYNLSNDDEYTYVLPFNSTLYQEMQFKIDSLVRTYMLENNMSSQIHNESVLDKYRNMVQLGKVSAGLGDFTVMIR